jgi:phosphinothricin acetyltransferase
MVAARIRPPIERDLSDLLRIYNHYVVNSHVTFDTEAFSIEERRPWFESFSSSGPHRLLVAELESEPVGYASSNELRAKPAYRCSVETAIYLDHEFVGRGIGQALFAALLDALESEDGVHRAYAGIALPNPGSLALHHRFGFELAGTFREAGYKFGRYWDVSWYEKNLEC